LRRGTIFDDRHNHQSARLVDGFAQCIRHCDSLQRDAQPSTRDTSVLEQRRYDAVDSCRRNNKDLAARAKCRHADATAGGIEYGTALLRLRKANVERDASVN
jgi:hypothetical protein